MLVTCRTQYPRNSHGLQPRIVAARPCFSYFVGNNLYSVHKHSQPWVSIDLLVRGRRLIPQPSGHLSEYKMQAEAPVSFDINSSIITHFNCQSLRQSPYNQNLFPIQDALRQHQDIDVNPSCYQRNSHWAVRSYLQLCGCNRSSRDFFDSSPRHGY
jgi:hypothetical protein